MFKCENCNQISLPKVQQSKVVYEIRHKKYYEMEHSTNDLGEPITVQGRLLGEGCETVTEKVFCQSCAAKFKKVYDAGYL